MTKQTKKKPDNSGTTIALNKKARHEYFIEDRFEAGIALEGWEVKSLRAGRAQISESYVLIRDREAFLWMPNHAITDRLHPYHPRPDAYPQTTAAPGELDRLIGQVERKGYTLVPTAMYWKKNGRVKVEIGLAKGKQLHDKRATDKDRDWQRDRQRILKAH